MDGIQLLLRLQQSGGCWVATLWSCLFTDVGSKPHSHMPHLPNAAKIKSFQNHRKSAEISKQMPKSAENIQQKSKTCHQSPKRFPNLPKHQNALPALLTPQSFLEKGSQLLRTWRASFTSPVRNLGRKAHLLGYFWVFGTCGAAGLNAYWALLFYYIYRHNTYFKWSFFTM